ncbi:hypothetical protein QYE76_028765 [Lolium multiflorum]|uniref:Uncharacterized protein n=1 Tax=Lolium multiflorum TaxID=4521 RepID=A0AAD8QMC9_LOLMU|nr:hypothetical protein QYE76_028765 [Lolium multiflorum]
MMQLEPIESAPPLLLCPFPSNPSAMDQFMPDLESCDASLVVYGGKDDIVFLWRIGSAEHDQELAELWLTMISQRGLRTVHRIGRTGRVSATGIAYTFFCGNNARYASDLVKILEGTNQTVSQQLRDMVSRGGYGGRPRERWASSNDSFGGQGSFGLEIAQDFSQGLKDFAHNVVECWQQLTEASQRNRKQ